MYAYKWDALEVYTSENNFLAFKGEYLQSVA